MRDIGNNVMKSVKINKDELLKIIRSNKEKHILEYNESVKDYLDLVTKITHDNQVLAITRDLKQISKMKSKPLEPTSYEDSYVRAIRMLELSVEDIIELDAQTFNQLVLDEWQWKQQFAAISSSYKSI